MSSHILVGGLTGGLPGAIGAGTSQTLIDEAGKLISDSDLPTELKQALVIGAGTFIGAATGGTAGASTAFNATTNNYLNHVDASRLAELQKKANAGPLTPQEAQERQDLILKDQQTTAELDACRTKNTVQCQAVKADFAQAQQSFLPNQQDIKSSQRIWCRLPRVLMERRFINQP